MDALDAAGQQYYGTAAAAAGTGGTGPIGGAGGIPTWGSGRNPLADYHFGRGAGGADNPLLRRHFGGAGQAGEGETHQQTSGGRGIAVTGRQPTSTGLVMPASGTITSPLLAGRRRGERRHAGIDITGPRGSPIYAAAGGKVVRNRWQTGYGWTVDTQGDDGRLHRYGHLLEQPNLSEGTQVQKGQVIAKMGASGTGNPNRGFHLHYETRTGLSAASPFARPGPRDVPGGLQDPARVLGVTPGGARVMPAAPLTLPQFGPARSGDVIGMPAGQAGRIGYNYGGLKAIPGTTYPGQTGVVRGFAMFQSPEAGAYNMAEQIRRNYYRHAQMTPREMIFGKPGGHGGWVGPEHSPAHRMARAQALAGALGIGIDDRIPMERPGTMGRIMDEFGLKENSVRFGRGFLERVERIPTCVPEAAEPGQRLRQSVAKETAPRPTTVEGTAKVDINVGASSSERMKADAQQMFKPPSGRGGTAMPEASMRD